MSRSASSSRTIDRRVQVRHVTIDTNRVLSPHARNIAANLGNRFRVRRRRTCIEALPWLMLSATATSAAAQSSISAASSVQFCRVRH